MQHLFWACCDFRNFHGLQTQSVWQAPIHELPISPSADNMAWQSGLGSRYCSKILKVTVHCTFMFVCRVRKISLKCLINFQSAQSLKYSWWWRDFFWTCEPPCTWEKQETPSWEGQFVSMLASCCLPSPRQDKYYEYSDNIDKYKLYKGQNVLCSSF